MSVHDTESMFEILAGAFAIPVIFNDKPRIGQALLFSAAAIALTLSVRLQYESSLTPSMASMMYHSLAMSGTALRWVL